MEEQPVYDVVIAGAGPAGATAAYFLAKGGKRVALLEKATFPRDKRCGDAWCEPALDILEEMGVIQELDAEGAVQWVRSGGLVSPSGLSFTSPDEGEREGAPRVAAIRRMVCDERIARAAVGVGATLIEGAAVSDVKLGGGRWSVRCKGGRQFTGRCLIAADGAKSKIARGLGVVNTGANSVASRYRRGRQQTLPRTARWLGLCPLRRTGPAGTAVVPDQGSGPAAWAPVWPTPRAKEIYLRPGVKLGRPCRATRAASY